MHLGVTGTIERRGEGGKGEKRGRREKAEGEEAGRGGKATLSPSHRLFLLLKGNSGTTTSSFGNPAVYTCKHFIVPICTIKMLCSNYK
jgi:hypothetical protein